MSRRHYIIVVHGIGEQKLNETTTPLIHRFAEERNKKPAGFYKNLLPSYLSAQAVRGHEDKGHGWSEFEGIPVDPPVGPMNSQREFKGKPATDPHGVHFRFVDLHWAHILKRHQKEYASSTENWAEALRFRLKEASPEKWTSPWQARMLDHLIETILPVKKILNWYRPEITDRIFNDFLGDVHLYGDYARTRGQAVRHFHVILDEIHIRDLINWSKFVSKNGENAHELYQPPRYTVIAHSLGSIMSFDALVYAHADESLVRSQKASTAHPCPSLPFLGYTDTAEGEEDTWQTLINELKSLEGDENLENYKKAYLQNENHQQSTVSIPPLKWVDYLENFITLGSPIDKYHILWWQNYFHMGLGSEFGGACDNWWNAGGRKILHYNLCDEQDPVGHHLDVAQDTRNYGIFFDTEKSKDIVFRRYAVPGLAHVKYWEDTELFKRVIGEVIDKKSGEVVDVEHPEFRKLEGIYEKALTWAYFRIPFIVAAVTGVLITYGLLGILPCLTEFAHNCDWAIDRVVALLAAILLWSCPDPSKGYDKESCPEQQGKASWRVRLRFRRSVFAHLVAGAVEWRRVLILLRKRKASKRHDELPTDGGFWTEAWKRYLGGVFVLGLSVFVLWSGLGNEQWLAQAEIRVGVIGVIMSVVYLAVMVYVWVVFVKAKTINQSGS